MVHGAVRYMDAQVDLCAAEKMFALLDAELHAGKGGIDGQTGPGRVCTYGLKHITDQGADNRRCAFNDKLDLKIHLVIETTGDTGIVGAAAWVGDDGGRQLVGAEVGAGPLVDGFGHVKAVTGGGGDGA